MVTSDAYRLFEVYSTLDEACAQEGALPARAYAQVARFIDDMRFANPTSEFLALAERILVTMHRLQIALRNTSDNSDALEWRNGLKNMCDEWLGACPLCRGIPAPQPDIAAAA
jgi:hypothetical protein